MGHLGQLLVTQNPPPGRKHASIQGLTRGPPRATCSLSCFSCSFSVFSSVHPHGGTVAASAPGLSSSWPPSQQAPWAQLGPHVCHRTNHVAREMQLSARPGLSHTSASHSHCPGTRQGGRGALVKREAEEPREYGWQHIRSTAPQTRKDPPDKRTPLLPTLRPSLP